MDYQCEIGAGQAETEGYPVMRMIVVDDEPRQRKGLVELIRRLRAEDEVLAMKDGEQVLQYVRDKEVDIVFSVNIPFTKCTLFADQVHPFR